MECEPSPLWIERRGFVSNKPRKMTLEKKHNLTGWAFLAPATFLLVVFSFWPMIKALVLSFQTGKGRNMQMAGFTNYETVSSFV